MLNKVAFSIKIIFLLAVLFTTNKEIYAAHLVGGTMSYECLGNDDYRITLTIFRDCNGSGAPFDAQAPIAIYNSNGNLNNTQLVPFTASTPVPIILNDPCLGVPPNVCIEKTDYIFTVNLPPIVGGYNIVYQRCCRNASATNIITPGNMGSTYMVHIPETSIAVCNNSPTFNNPPPTAMCAGSPFTYDLSATDVDGDSLYYSFRDPFNGGSNAAPAPNPPAPPPFNNIAWAGGYSTNNQIDANPLFTINPQTGFLSGTPTNIGTYTVSFGVKEYRNGIFINEVYRDFLIFVSNCPTVTAEFSDQINQSGQSGQILFCNGTTVNFTNGSTNSTNYYWDFGDPSTIADTSTLQSPAYTYADTGVYNVMLVANPGLSCSDTAFHEFSIYPALEPSFILPSNQCLLNNSFSFNAIGSNFPDDTITWNFGGSAIPPIVIDSFAQVSFSSSGAKPIELIIQNFGCTKSYFDTIQILDNPIAVFDPQSNFCDGLIVQFNSYSLNISDYFWDFGDPSITTDTSILALPAYTYADTGIYNVVLIANQQNLCYDTAYRTYEVFEPINATFSNQPSQCFLNNSFTLNAQGNYNGAATINWSFGSFGSPLTSNSPQVQVSFLDTGAHIVNLNIQNHGCSSSYTDTFYVFLNPSINFSLLEDAGCQPFTTFFYDSSSASTPITYLWDFGDGTTSSTANPTHTYLSAGLFDVNLTISTTSGCVETKTLSIPGLITVHPKPESKDKVTPTETYFLNHVITAEDFSNVIYQEFNFGDGSVFTNQYVEYSYLDTGHYLFQHLVINEFGCRDTSYRDIWIKSDFLFFVPNAFTPDGDGLNDVFFPKIWGMDENEYELQIFNRWGDLFFSSKDINIGWNGTFKNNPVPLGVYTWRIVLKTIDHRIHKRVGNINLIR
ncbi:MAG: hypothetical protein COA97_07245 [Flavobacteriales bacterium]|nr:MAG: hypothetical protein COA97_07245 [Flavobacteriales bacterium]